MSEQKFNAVEFDLPVGAEVRNSAGSGNMIHVGGGRFVSKIDQYIGVSMITGASKEPKSQFGDLPRDDGSHDIKASLVRNPLYNGARYRRLSLVKYFDDSGK